MKFVLRYILLHNESETVKYFWLISGKKCVTKRSKSVLMNSCLTWTVVHFFC